MSSYNDFVDQMLRDALNKKHKKEESKEDLSSAMKAEFNPIDAALIVERFITTKHKDIIKDFFRETVRNENMRSLSNEDLNEITDCVIDILDDIVMYGYRKVKEDHEEESNPISELGKLTDAMMNITSIDESKIKVLLEKETFPKDEFFDSLFRTSVLLTGMVSYFTKWSSEEVNDKIRRMYKEEDDE